MELSEDDFHLSVEYRFLKFGVVLKWEKYGLGVTFDRDLKFCKFVSIEGINALR